MRIGSGFDAHRFDEARPLIVGGVEVRPTNGLAGHSDADVLSHAIADALLGAAALGDLGVHFPNSPEWSESSSLTILTSTAGKVREAGFEIVNVDATVIAEAPKLSPHRDEMVANIAAALGVEPERVSVKFTSTDGLGSTGRSEGMAASAVALITS